MEYDSLLKVTNNRKEIVIFMWAKSKYICPPEGTIFVPFDAVVSKLGDPRSGPTEAEIKLEGGSVLRVPARSAEMKRLAVSTGVFNPRDVEAIIAKLPDVTVTNMDSDEPIVFPAVDPECAEFVPVSQNKSEIAAMQRQLDKQRRTLALLEQQLKARKVGPTPSTIPAEDVEEDTPDNSPQRIIN